jgi:hypothetical protein
LKFSVRHHGVAIFLPEELLVDEEVDRRRERPGKLALKEADRPSILLSTKD